jgi:UDP-glucose 4-epimerase
VEQPGSSSAAGGGPTGLSAAAARRVLVTGGAGFIGSHLCDALLARGDSVVVVDDLSTGRRENLAIGHARLRLIESTLGRAIESGALDVDGAFDEVYHLAAAVGVKLVMDDPIGSIETNVGETSALLRWAQVRVPRARVLVASSSEVYGKSDKPAFNEEDDVVYGPTTKARWSYAFGKALDEHLTLAYAQQRGLAGVVVRLFNTVGPRQVGEYGMVLPRFVASALRNEALVVHGDGAQARCFCDVRDVVPALMKLCATTACAGRVFNVGSDASVSILDLARRVVAVVGSSSVVRTEAYESVYGPGFEDLRRRRPDLARVRAAIGFVPTIELERTIADIARFQRQGRWDPAWSAGAGATPKAAAGVLGAPSIPGSSAALGPTTFGAAALGVTEVRS